MPVMMTACSICAGVCCALSAVRGPLQAAYHPRRVASHHHIRLNILQKSSCVRTRIVLYCMLQVVLYNQWPSRASQQGGSTLWAEDRAHSSADLVLSHFKVCVQVEVRRATKCMVRRTQRSANRVKTHCRITLKPAQAWVQGDGVSTRVTTAPAPMTAPSPMVSPPFFVEITMAEPPNQQSLPMVIGCANSGPAHRADRGAGLSL